jgi:hypothetical protein
LRIGSWAKAAGIKEKYLWHLKKDLTLCIIYWTWVSYKIFTHEFAKFHHFEKSKWSCITDSLPTLNPENHRRQTTTHKRTLKTKIGKRRPTVLPLSRKNLQNNPEFIQWGWRNVMPEVNHTVLQKRPRMGPLDTWLTKEVTAPNDVSRNTTFLDGLIHPTPTGINNRAPILLCHNVHTSSATLPILSRQKRIHAPHITGPQLSGTVPTSKRTCRATLCQPNFIPEQTSLHFQSVKRFFSSSVEPYHLLNSQSKRFKEYFALKPP